MLLAILLFPVTHNDAIRPIHTAKSNMRRWEHGHDRSSRTRIWQKLGSSHGAHPAIPNMLQDTFRILDKNVDYASPDTRGEGQIVATGRSDAGNRAHFTKNQYRDVLQSAGSRSRGLRDTPSTAAKMHNLHFYPVCRQLPGFRAVLTPSAPYRRMNRSG